MLTCKMASVSEAVERLAVESDGEEDEKPEDANVPETGGTSQGAAKKKKKKKKKSATASEATG